MSTDRDRLRSALACYPSGVTAVCALIDGRPCGLAASSFTSVSLDPPLVSICIAHTSETWLLLGGAARIGVSVLAEAHADAVRALAGKGIDRFAEIDWHERDGAVFVHGSSLWLECTIYQHIAAGDHDIVLLAVDAVEPYPDVAPIVFHGRRLRQLAPA